VIKQADMDTVEKTTAANATGLREALSVSAHIELIVCKASANIEWEFQAMSETNGISN
jgi:hypothetical protein